MSLIAYVAVTGFVKHGVVVAGLLALLCVGVLITTGAGFDS